MLDDPFEDRLDSHPRLGAHAQDLILGALEQLRQFAYGCFASTVVFNEIPLVDCEGRLVGKEAGGGGTDQRQ